MTDLTKLKELAAVRTLEALGYTYHGSEQWKPPIGKAPDFDLIDRLKAENEALKEIISECATACGAAVSTECSLEFMKMLPQEIASVIGGLRKQLEKVHPFKFAGQPEVPDLKCAACGGYHYGLPPNMPCPKNAAISQDAALEGGGR